MPAPITFTVWATQDCRGGTGREAGLLTLDDVGVAEIGCGAGVVSWVGPPEATFLWRRIESLLDDVEHHPLSHQPGEYRAELWRAADGRHVIVLSDE